MEWLDRHFIALPPKKKAFLAAIWLVYLVIAAIGYAIGFMSLTEAFLIFVVGVIYTELLKLHYRVQDLEKKGNRKRP